MNPIISQPFQKPRRSDPCFCGSDLKFKSCCGDLSEDRKRPYGIAIVENFLSESECEQLLDIADKSPKYWLDVSFRDEDTGSSTSTLKNTIRNTQGVDLDKHKDLIEEIARRAWTEAVPATTGQFIEWYEPFEMLRYQKGGFYITHSDAERYLPEDKCWERTFDRDLSLLIYINSNFEGGQLNFPNFDYSYQPQAGDLVIFPSDHRYIHQAQSVSSGIRYALVSWAAALGGLRSFEAAREGVIHTDKSTDKNAVAARESSTGQTGLLNRFKKIFSGNTRTD